MLPFNTDHEGILETLQWADDNKSNKGLVNKVMEKAAVANGINCREASLLLVGADDSELFALANEIKMKYYGKRVVLFAPLYLSNHCVNSCVYCPYCASNQNMPRLKLTLNEIKEQVTALQEMGHKRVVIEAGQHPVHNPLEYILEAVEAIYEVRHKNGAIRRVNVNIGATTMDEYKRLSKAKIGTYTLFQETYHRETYNKLHPKPGPKSDYEWHLQAMDRAMEGGVSDVGLGALFGLADYRYDFTALLMHAEHLESTYGVGPHTVSVPRVRKAKDVSFEHEGVDDNDLLRIVACMRIAAPYTGIIASTRESEEMRGKMLEVGVSQISGGSKTGVGGYNKNETATNQFEIHDNRTLSEIVDWLMDIGHIPSFCTACYNSGRVGDRFMALCKSGQIQNCCHPNALMTLQEYLLDYSTESTRHQGEMLIQKEIKNIAGADTKALVLDNLKKIKSGRRDFRI